MFGLKGWEWIIILVIALLIFGANRLPDIGRALGKSIHSFKRGLKEAEDEIEDKKEEKKG